ncbi:MAG: hypothetical protein AB3N28_06625 [Kordiimonas sp.]
MKRSFFRKHATAYLGALTLLCLAHIPTFAANTSIASTHIYVVKKDGTDQATTLQKELHTFYTKQAGFIGSFVLEDTKDATIRQDYSFWKDMASFNNARAKAKTLASQQTLASITERIVSDQIGNTHGGTHHREAELGKAVVEMAVFNLKRPFNEGFLPVRATVKEWLDHHRGSNGYITLPSTSDSKQMADVVLWTNLDDALYAANLLGHLDFGQRLNNEISGMTYYGHFNIHAQYFKQGLH